MITVDEATPTGTIVVLVGPDGERSMFTDRGASLALSDRRRARRGCSPAPRSSTSRATPSSPRRRGRPCGGCGRAARRGRSDHFGGPVLAGRAGERRAGRVPRVDEPAPPSSSRTTTRAACSRGWTQPGAIVEALLEHYPTVALKLGPAGSARRHGRTAAASGSRRPLGPVVDTTGAGDAFSAGFLANLAGGRRPRCLRGGSRGGGGSGRRPGRSATAATGVNGSAGLAAERRPGSGSRSVEPGRQAPPTGRAPRQGATRPGATRRENRGMTGTGPTSIPLVRHWIDGKPLRRDRRAAPATSTTPLQVS